MKRAIIAIVLFTTRLCLAGDEREVCARSAERFQGHRDAGRFEKARAELLVCTREGCPPFIRTDCAQWLDELSKMQPTVVLSVRSAKGADLVDVRVSVDGVLIASRLTGSPIPVDPGEHVLRVEADGFRMSEQRILAVQHVKGRLLEIVLEPASLRATTAPPSEAPKVPSVAGKPRPTTSGSPLPWILGGIGVAGLGAFTFFEVRGHAQYDAVEQGCGSTPRGCPDDELAPARTSFRAAAVSLGIGVVGLGGAVLAAFIGTKEKKVAVLPSSGGGSVLVHF